MRRWMGVRCGLLTAVGSGSWTGGCCSLIGGGVQMVNEVALGHVLWKRVVRNISLRFPLSCTMLEVAAAVVATRYPAADRRAVYL